jgi:nicotinate-nucleotide adenylyltransferase
VDKPLRIGIFGGTFDPVHNVHLRIARAARDRVGLDRVLFVVAATPPHKRDEVVASAEDRLAMVRAATQGEEGFEASRIEMDRPGPSYTVDTVRALAEAHPGARLYLIIGYDAALDLPRWRDPRAILKRARLIVVRRPECDSALDPSLDGMHEMLPFEASDLSSTEVRDLLAQGGDARELLPPAVLEHIRGKGLYGCR